MATLKESYFQIDARYTNILHIKKLKLFFSKAFLSTTKRRRSLGGHPILHWFYSSKGSTQHLATTLYVDGIEMLHQKGSKSEEKSHALAFLQEVNLSSVKVKC